MVPPCRSRKSSEFQRVKAGLARAIRSGNKRNCGTVQRDDWLDEGTFFRGRWRESLSAAVFRRPAQPGPPGPSSERSRTTFHDLQPSDRQRCSNTDRWQTRRRPALSEKTGWTIPSRTWQKGTSTPCCRVSWNLTVSVATAADGILSDQTSEVSYEVRARSGRSRDRRLAMRFNLRHREQGHFE